MDRKTTDLLVSVETRTRQMLMHYKKMQQQLTETRLQLEQKDHQIALLKDEAEKARRDYDRLKAAKYIDMADDEIKDIKGRIRKMVRDIDTCIAMLKTD